MCRTSESQGGRIRKNAVIGQNHKTLHVPTIGKLAKNLVAHRATSFRHTHKEKDNLTHLSLLLHFDISSKKKLYLY